MFLKRNETKNFVSVKTKQQETSMIYGRKMYQLSSRVTFAPGCIFFKADGTLPANDGSTRKEGNKRKLSDAMRTIYRVSESRRK